MTDTTEDGHEDFIAWTIREFRENHGKVGGPFEGAPLLLLHTRGAKTGQPRIHPMMYLADGPRYLVFASKAGADRNPAWYHNLLAHSTSTIEVGDRRIDVTATELHGADRDRQYAEQARRYPGFAGYERKTQRVIPVIALTPVQSSATDQPEGDSA
ncbi:nitroreductase family deazaflavin-dependent oxidoreductase [Leekyejoonella antrihumi]|uniref:Nitroreductase family deazaflavin-dependent oxidoreductase n=1 Tax=Leekyejoonella antrihumi TaxID=1660198 RepID=A0A563DUE9_9MICO|nr:nitroreductase family deazaflavin-dependent oxidoreductase [Leekyejoonella antrihumi]TWP33887.1 nitroreductase family deazaflavin-dependent oxidoreductase [Leekyejoonella antrihumi]